jgi:hypothetical protein
MPKGIVYQSFPASFKTYNLEAFGVGYTGDGADGCIHAWGVAACGDYSDGSGLSQYVTLLTCEKFIMNNQLWEKSLSH